MNWLAENIEKLMKNKKAFWAFYFSKEIISSKNLKILSL